MTDCISRDHLEAFAEGALGPARAAAVARHLDDCADCAARAAAADPLADSLDGLSEPPVPLELVTGLREALPSPVALRRAHRLRTAGLLALVVLSLTALAPELEALGRLSPSPSSAAPLWALLAGAGLLLSWALWPREVVR